MKKILTIFQELLKITLLFLAAYIWLNYFLDSKLLIILLSSGISLFIEFLLLILNKKNKNKIYLKNSEKDDAENMFLSLANDQNSLDFFFKLVKSRHKDCEKRKNFVIVKDNGVILYPYTKFETLGCDTLIKIIRETKKNNIQKLVITCNEYDNSLISFAKNYDIEILILDKFETYSLLYKEYDFYPTTTLKYKKNSSFSIKELFSNSFNRSKAKGYIFASIITLFSIFFIKMNIYYMIFASILLIFALFSLFNTKFNRKITKNVI